MSHDPTYYCHGIECLKQFHPHPAKGPTLAEGQTLGKSGLDRMFPAGSLWHYGPVYENMETIVRVLPSGAEHSGRGASLLRDHNLPGAPATWFITCEVVSSPHAVYPKGHVTGLPPCAMIPREYVVAERTPRGCCCCPCQPAQSEVELLRLEVERWKAQTVREADQKKQARERADKLQRKLTEIRDVVR